MKQDDTRVQIKINGSNIELGEALPLRIKAELAQVAETNFGHLHHATVGFSREGHWYCCIINVHVSNLRVIVAESIAADGHQAFENALAKIGPQLIRRKRRIANGNPSHEAAPVRA